MYIKIHFNNPTYLYGGLYLYSVKTLAPDDDALVTRTPATYKVTAHQWLNVMGSNFT